jgi:hypothetical protein
MSAVVSSSVTPPSVRSCFGVRGLPTALATLAAGQVYAIEVESQALRVALLAQTLRDTLNGGGACTVVMPGDPAAFLAKARLCGADLGWFVQSERLNLVRQRADPALPVFRGGPATLLESIDRSVPEGRTLLILEQAEPLLFLADSGHAAEASEGLRRWAARRGIAVLATFAPTARPQREFLALRAAAEDFAGLVVVREHEGGARLDVRHWFADAGVSPRCSVTMRLGATGELSAEPPPALPSGVRDDTGQVVCIETALDDPVGAVRDSSWSLVKGHADAIEAGRRMANGAIVLAFDRGTSLRSLCHTLVSLRRVAAPWVALVVRERGMRLRLAQQMALTRLGASTIVPDPSDDAALAVAIRALAGSAFMRPVPDDVEGTIAAAGTAAAPQLLVTRAFRDMIAEVLSVSDAIDLPHSLVHLACDPAKAQQLGTLALQRKIRDAALTVDPSGLWLFLFGCPASRASGVAERAFGRYYPEVSASITVAGTLGTIAQRVERLSAAVGMPDIDARRGVTAGRALPPG